MANKDPAFLFYPSDFLTGTMFLSDEQVGKYIKLLCVQHQQGSLSKKHMMQICGEYDEDVFSKFKIDDNGKYYNERLQVESIKRRKYSESRSRNRLSKKEDVDICETYDNTYEKHMVNRNRDINKDTNKDTKKDKNIVKLVQIPYQEIVEYLNEKTNSNYRHTTKSNKSLIDARFNEGFVLEDFKKVIDNKVSEWQGTEFEKFLRPQTLFGTKFESYLNQKKIKKLNHEGREIDDSFEIPF